MRVYVYIDAYNCIISFMLFLQEHLKNKRFYILRKKIMNKMLSYLFVITKNAKMIAYNLLACVKFWQHCEKLLSQKQRSQKVIQHVNLPIPFFNLSNVKNTQFEIHSDSVSSFVSASVIY